MNTTERLIRDRIRNNIHQWSKEGFEVEDREMIIRMLAIFWSDLKASGIVVIEDEKVA